MEWFKVYHGTPDDPKFHVIAARAKADLCAVLCVWWKVMDCASQSAPRGSIAALDVEVVAASLRIDEESVRAILSAMRDKGMIDGESLPKFVKRQFRGEDNTAAERQAEKRARDRAASEGGSDEKLRDSTVTARYSAVTSRSNGSEKNRTEKTPPIAPPTGGVEAEASPDEQLTPEEFERISSAIWKAHPNDRRGKLQAWQQIFSAELAGALNKRALAEKALRNHRLWIQYWAKQGCPKSLRNWLAEQCWQESPPVITLPAADREQEDFQYIPPQEPANEEPWRRQIRERLAASNAATEAAERERYFGGQGDSSADAAIENAGGALA